MGFAAVEVMRNGTKVRLVEQGSELYTIIGHERHNGMTFYRLAEIVGGLFLKARFEVVEV